MGREKGTYNDAGVSSSLFRVVTACNSGLADEGVDEGDDEGGAEWFCPHYKHYWPELSKR